MLVSLLKTCVAMAILVEISVSMLLSAATTSLAKVERKLDQCNKVFFITHIEGITPRNSSLI